VNRGPRLGAFVGTANEMATDTAAPWLYCAVFREPRPTKNESPPEDCFTGRLMIPCLLPSSDASAVYASFNERSPFLRVQIPSIFMELTTSSFTSRTLGKLRITIVLPSGWYPLPIPVLRPVYGTGLHGC
jgi:hypothetical protein